MAKYIKEGEVIHAEHTDSHARKIEWKGFRRNPYTQELMMLYECDRNSFSKIVKVCDGIDCKKEGTENFHCEIGDILEADAISIYIRTKRKLKLTVDEGVTGRHGAIFLNPRVYAISKIKTPLACLFKYLEMVPLLENKVKVMERK